MIASSRFFWLSGCCGCMGASAEPSPQMIARLLCRLLAPAKRASGSLRRLRIRDVRSALSDRSLALVHSSKGFDEIRSEIGECSVDRRRSSDDNIIELGGGMLG